MGKVKILKNNRIKFYVDETKKWELFGFLEDNSIRFNITKKTIRTHLGFEMEERIPNPNLEFYIELAEKLKDLKYTLK